MIDLHSHILPGLDHGPSGWDEALEMARLAVADGIAEMAATPHVNFQFRSSPENIRESIAAFRESLGREGIPLKVHVGADYLLTPELLAESDTIITLGDNGRYFLLELPPMAVPPNILDILGRFIDRGLHPIITHPERDSYLAGRPKLLERMSAMGCLLQITSWSLEGFFGKLVQKAAGKLIGRGLCHVLASDAHLVSERPPRLSMALPAVNKLIGPDRARRLILDNPAAILLGKPLD